MSEHSLTVQTLAYAGLDALRIAIPLELCAYLHEADGAGPQLYLRSPDLSALDASRAFDLFTALRDALALAAPGEATSADIAGFHSLAVATRGAASRGLFVLGRRETGLDAGEAAVVEEMARAVSGACHAVEATLGEQPGRRGAVSVGVQVSDGAVRATVTVATATGRAEGHGEAGATAEAVALAALAAASPGAKLAEVTDGSIGGERVVLVLVRGAHDRGAVGAALVGTDPLQATASAALEAASRLDADGAEAG